MNNIKNFIILAIVLTILGACQKAKPLLYDRDANIHFQLLNSQRDSIVYTFAYNMNLSSDTVFIPVRLAGYRTENVRQFEAYVEQDSSTAISGLHYKTLDVSYPMAANTGYATLPIIVYNIAELEENSVSLIVKLKANDDFNIEDPKLIRAKIILSGQLEKPIWWDMWLPGYYSRVKHQLFLIVTEQTSMTTLGLDAPRNLYFVSLLNMMLSNPFEWITNNPEKGYRLTSNNNETYDFYHEANPNRKIPLRKNVASGKYFFIDENGMEVN